MGFKMKTFHEVVGIDETSTVNRPVFVKKLDSGVAGEANRDGTTFIDDDVPKELRQEVVNHEDVHHDQMIQGRLGYTHDHVYWKENTKAPLKVFARENMQDGNPEFTWEKEAYAKEDEKAKQNEQQK